MTKDRTAHKPIFIIPFFNEQRRLDIPNLETFLAELNCDVLLVDDGSIDDTFNTLSHLSQRFSNISVFQINENVGKANALRIGMLRAIRQGYTHIGTSDADLSVPVFDLNRALTLSLGNSHHITSGARVRLAGVNVSRPFIRLWVGRVIATLVSLTTKVAMYDMQSPCKVYQVSTDLEKALTLKFSTKWFGEAELLMRMNPRISRSKDEVLVKEFVLQEWSDVSGGHLSLMRSIPVFLDIMKLMKSRLNLQSQSF